MEGAKVIRKSCDLCYRRKMKCNGLKPRCSQCVTYDIDCTYTAPSRIKKRKREAQDEDDISDTQSRLKRLEFMVQQATQRLDDFEKQDAVEKLFHEEETSAMDSLLPSSMTMMEGDNNSPTFMALPPSELVIPIVQAYIRDFNSALPLFQADALMRMVRDCYSVGPPQRDPVAWAAINVVLALASQHNLVHTHGIPSSTACLGKAQSVLSSVVLGNVQLLNIQVLVGMVMLLQTSQDIKPAVVLIATTIRLAHTMGLHDRAYSTHLDPLHARQRACVFWLAYIFDKDLSMRSKQPSVQNDDDINLDLPSPMPRVDRNSDFGWPSPTISQYDEDISQMNNVDDAAGVLTTTDGSVKINFLTTRVQLAAIEGGVYDYIYSTRSRKRSLEERLVALQSVARELEKWKASIPFEFHASECPRRVQPSMRRFIGALHATSLACTTLIRQADAWNVEWVTSIRKYSRSGIEPVLPPKWEVLVGEARDLLVLYGAIGEADRGNFWATACPCLTAMMLLTANSIHRPTNYDLSLDIYLVEIGLQKVHKMIEETNDERLISFEATCTELHQRALQIRANAGNNIENSSDPYVAT